MPPPVSGPSATSRCGEVHLEQWDDLEPYLLHGDSTTLAEIYDLLEARTRALPPPSPATSVPAGLTVPSLPPRRTVSAAAGRANDASTLVTSLARGGNAAVYDWLLEFVNTDAASAAALIDYAVVQEPRARERVISQLAELAEQFSPRAALALALQMRRRCAGTSSDSEMAALHSFVTRALSGSDSEEAFVALFRAGIDYDAVRHTVTLR